MFANDLTFVTVKWGTKYPADYVNILFDMVRRNLPTDFPCSFVCFTDDATGLLQHIKTRTLPGDLSGWWNKLYLFKPGLFDVDQRLFFLDLDTVITGDFSSIAAYQGSFAILRDFFHPNGLNSSLMLWKSGFGHAIWQSFEAAGFPDISGGDQAWIERCRPQADILQDLYPDMIVSFKEKAHLGLPDGARIVCFHGIPRPHEVKNGWVEKVWKIGGAAPTPEKTATPETTALDNVRHTLSLSLPVLENASPTDESRKVCIMGGGASARGLLKEIKTRRQQGYALWTINAAHRHLMESGLEPDAHIIAAPTARHAAHVPDRGHAILLYASQCHRDVFEKARRLARRVIVWHPHLDGIRTLIGSHPSLIIGGGATTGAKAVALAQALGFGRIDLYGFDSSFAADEGGGSEPHIGVEIDALSFASSPRLAHQVNEMRRLSEFLRSHGVALAIHGEGLLPYVAQKLVNLHAL